MKKFDKFLITWIVLGMIDIICTVVSIMKFGIQAEGNGMMRWMIYNFDYYGFNLEFLLFFISINYMLKLIFFLEDRFPKKMKNLTTMFMIVLVCEYIITYWIHIVGWIFNK